MALDFEQVDFFETKLKNFCDNHKKIYLYGAGIFGKTFYSYCKETGIEVEGFITTDGSKEKLFGKKIYKAEKMQPLLHRESGIILSVSEDTQREIMKSVRLDCDFFSFTNMEYAYLEVAKFLQDKYYSMKRWDFQKKIIGYNWKKILVVQLEVTFGDMIWSTAFYRELRGNFPDADITLVMNEKYISLYKNCPYINHIVPYVCDSLIDCISTEMVKKVEIFASEKLDGGYDVVFQPRLLPLTFSDAWENILLAQESGARYRIAHALYMTEDNRFRYKIVRNMFSEIIKHTRAEHETKQDLRMIEAFHGNVKEERMELWLSWEDWRYAERVLYPTGRDKMIISVALVGSVETRSWDPDKYGHVFASLVEKYKNQLLFVLCGGNDARNAADVVMKYIGNDCIDLTGKTSLTEAAAVISRSSLYIGSDTGLMHMASASGVPIVEISASIEGAPDYWGCTPVRTGPWKVPSVVLRPRKGLDECRFMCHKKYAHCINQITEGEVEGAVEKMWPVMVKKGTAYGSKG